MTLAVSSVKTKNSIFNMIVFTLNKNKAFIIFSAILSI